MKDPVAPFTVEVARLTDRDTGKTTLRRADRVSRNHTDWVVLRVKHEITFLPPNADTGIEPDWRSEIVTVEWRPVWQGQKVRQPWQQLTGRARQEALDFLQASYSRELWRSEHFQASALWLARRTAA